jgi:cell division septal protein FtsQ
MVCEVCGSPTDTGWDEAPLSICFDCSNKKTQENKVTIERERQTQFSANAEIQNTFKFRTVIFLILGLIIPLWLITLPLFWFFAYKSYKDGVPVNTIDTSSKITYSNLDELKKLKELLDSGVLNQEEYDTEKKHLLTK